MFIRLTRENLSNTNTKGGAMSDTNGWPEYKRQVLFQLDELTAVAKEIKKEVDALRQDVTILKVKAGLYGAAAGIIVAVISQIILAGMK